MAALVSVGGTRSRTRNRRGTPPISDSRDSGEWMKSCTTMAKGHPLSDASKKRTRTATNAQLSGDNILDILLRLPVKSLGRFQCVCKAWRGIISDPGFIRRHLERSASRWEQEPTFVITPITLDRRVVPDSYVIPGGEAWPWPGKFSGPIHFYQWKQSASSQASLLHAEDLSGEFLRLYFFAHCDGLVLIPTDTKLYLFNPATKDALSLPDSNRNNLRDAARSCHCAGLGLDPCTGKYKVVQPFYRYINTVTGTYEMGMEVFTVNGGDDGVWREIDGDLPYPISRRQTGVTVNGCLFWRVDKAYCRSKLRDLRVLVRFKLANETFGAIMLPDSLDLDESFALDMLRGELWLTARTSDEAVTIWSTPVGDGSDGILDLGRWERRYSFPFAGGCHPMALLPDSRLLFWNHSVLYGYELETGELTTVCEMDRIRYMGRRARTWKNLWSFNVLPYTESLLRITA